MPFVVACTACGKRLNIPDALYSGKIRGRVVTIACKGCGADIKVDGTRPREEVDLSLPARVDAETAKAGARSGGEVPAGAASPPGAAKKTDAEAAPPPMVPAPGGSPSAASEAARAATSPASVSAASAPGGAGGAARPAPKAVTSGGTLLGGAAPGGGPRSSQGRPAPPPLQVRPLGTPGSQARSGAGGAGLPLAGLPGIGGLPKPVAGVRAPGAARTLVGGPAAVPRAEAGAPAIEPSAAEGLGSVRGALPATVSGTARRRGVPPTLQRTSPESPAARPLGPRTPLSPAASRPIQSSPGASPEAPPTPGPEGGGAGASVADWLWAVSFGDDDDRELTFAEVRAAILAGEVTRDTIAWRDGLADWLPLGEIDSFAACFAEGGPPAGVGTAAAVVASPLDSPLPAAALAAGVQAAPAAVRVTAAAVDPRAMASAPPDAPTWASAASPNPSREASASESEAATERTGGVDDEVHGADSREDWRRSTADLLAELAGDVEAGPPKPLSAAAPIAADLEAEIVPRFPPPPRAPRVSLTPSLIPQRGAARWIAFGVVGLLVLGALAGLALLFGKVFSGGDDPTLRPTVSTAPVPSASAAGEVAAGAAAAVGTATASTANSGGIDLARAIDQNVDRGAGEKGVPFDERGAREVLTAAVQRASTCRKKGDEKGPAKVAVTFDPQTGKPSSVRLLGRYAGTESGTCIEVTLRAVRVSKYSGEPVTLEETVMLR